MILPLLKTLNRRDLLVLENTMIASRDLKNDPGNQLGSRVIDSLGVKTELEIGNKTIERFAVAMLQSTRPSRFPL